MLFQWFPGFPEKWSSILVGWIALIYWLVVLAFGYLTLAKTIGIVAAVVHRAHDEFLDEEG
jgi:hypothetical protein